MENDHPGYDCNRTTERVKGKVQLASKLVLLPPSRHTTTHGIDLEEEERLYAELLEDCTEDSQVISRRRTLSTPPEFSRSGPSPPNQRLRIDTFPRHESSHAYLPFTPIRRRPPRAESIFSSEIYLVDNTTGDNNSTRSSAPPLFAQRVKIDGWVIVGDGANPRQDVMQVPENLSPNPRNDDSRPSSPKKSTLGKSQVGSLKEVGSGSGAYVVYDIAITTREGTTIKILRRYSSFEELWQGLMASLATHLHSHVPVLPSKAPFARFRPAFLEKRRQLLEFWLTRVLLHPELGGRKVVKDWVLKY